MKELQAMSLTERRLEILDSLLSCEEIQPIVMKLVSLLCYIQHMYNWWIIILVTLMKPNLVSMGKSWN